MFISTVFALALSGSTIQDSSPISCPITLEQIIKGSKLTTWNGARFQYCCPGCDQQFEKDPWAAIEKAAKSAKTVGDFLFDPVSKTPIDRIKAKGGTSDFHGIRFHFQSAQNKATFDKDPKQFGSLPAKEALYCPVGKEVVKSYEKSSGYGDYQGVRYYFCCGGCETDFERDPQKYAPFANKYVQSPIAKTLQGR